MIDPTLAKELQALPLRILCVQDPRGTTTLTLGVPCLVADRPDEHPVVLVHFTGLALVLAAYTPEEFALPPGEADSACAKRIATALGYTGLVVVRPRPEVPAQRADWRPTWSKPLPCALCLADKPTVLLHATGELPAPGYVALGGTIIDYRDARNGLRWHRTYHRPFIAKINHAPVAPWPTPDTPAGIIRETFPPSGIPALPSAAMATRDHEGARRE